MGVEVRAFQRWIERWSLTVDGDPFVGPYAGSLLLPVRRHGQAAMLKLGQTEDERRGSAVMAWWGGGGAAPVLAYDDEALLMVRATGRRSLVELAGFDDDVASKTICRVVAELHRPRREPGPRLPPLERLFEGLRRAAVTDSRFTGPAATAAALLADPREPVVLHADVHHQNILDFEDLGWRAIDPWGFVGERAYDYANLLKNPTHELMTAPGRLRRQVEVIAQVAALDPARLLAWGYAHAGLSAAWCIEDGHDPSQVLELLAIARAELGA